MLNDGKLVEDFRHVHFDHTRVDLLPCFDLLTHERYASTGESYLLLTAEMSSNIGECHRSEAVLIYGLAVVPDKVTDSSCRQLTELMNFMHAK